MSIGRKYKEYPGRISCAYVKVSPCGTPYYVGAGSLGRARQRDRRLGGGLVLDEKDYTYYGRRPYTLIYECETRAEAFNLEAELIRRYGRMDLQTGPLYNETDGPGQGKGGMSEEGRLRIAEANRWREWSEKSREKVSKSLAGNRRRARK